MFPHELDRFRVIEHLLRHARDTASSPESHDAGLGQKALASRAGLLQTDISNIENLEQAAAKHNRRVSREKLIRLAILGLELVQPRLDVLLWLYDGSPLSPQDFRAGPYLRKYLPEGPSAVYGDEELHSHAAVWLREVGTYYTGPQYRAKLRPPDVFFPDDSDERDWVQVSQIRLDQERISGHCSRTSLLPHELVHPEINMADRAFDSRYYRSEELRKEALVIAEERRRVFYDRVATFGYRGIHSRQAISRYASDPSFSGLPLESRRKYAEALLDALRRYPYFEIGLVDAVPGTGLTVISTKSVVMRSVPHGPVDESFQWGRLFLVWTDERWVLRFLAEFETTWQRIPVQDRTKEAVIEQLERMLRPE